MTEQAEQLVAATDEQRRAVLSAALARLIGVRSVGERDGARAMGQISDVDLVARLHASEELASSSTPNDLDAALQDDGAT